MWLRLHVVVVECGVGCMTLWPGVALSMCIFEVYLPVSSGDGAVGCL